MALVCALIYKMMLPYCVDSYTRSQIEENQADFGKCAVGVLDSSFKENDPRSCSVLQVKNSDWNDHTVLDLAHKSKSMNFIAHPCCQELLKKRFFGNIKVRKHNIDFLIHLPNWFKVTISAILIFPILFWIIFPNEEKKSNESTDEDEGILKIKLKFI